MADEFVPQILWQDDEKANMTFMVRLEKCVICKTPTMAKLTHTSYFPFPLYWAQDQEHQMQRAGIRLLGGKTYSPVEGPICIVCAEQGLGRFTCTNCGQERKVSEQQERIGDPPEFLCKVCYETVPAKQWEELVDKLNEQHRWDFS